ncbi:unnamed protein product [Mytilus coruscus]|uniref:SWIM-type domain-containing protein n=1 Tax=Mytilus coruscus TaxID=42192 RepID=A0A6J8B3E9_MYTCO|nr:unnamed protein product [Mytilus coruscus]
MHKYDNSEKSRPLKVTRTTQDDCDQDFIPPKVARTSKQLSSPPSVCLNILGASNSHARCVVCKKPGPKFLVVSSDARFQAFIDGNVLIPAGARKSFSLHKSRPLVKPMVVVSTTGHFVAILGPYLSRNNDASILNHMMKCNVDDIKSCVNDKDIFVVDRGLRDSITLLEELSIKAAMPTFMKKGGKQMSDADANTSRMVTKVPFIGDYIRIVCAISNKYLPPLSKATNEDEDINLATQMKQKSREINTLKAYVEENNLQGGTVQWKPIQDSDIPFPQLTDEQLRSLTCGVYQLKLSSSYIQEYMEGDSQICFHKDAPDLLRIRIQSRHVSSKKYFVWIEYSESDVNSWYCTCRAGARVVGVCAHVTAIIWYLSSARNAGTTSYGVKDWSTYLSDAKNLPETIDSSESETERCLGKVSILLSIIPVYGQCLQLRFQGEPDISLRTVLTAVNQQSKDIVEIIDDKVTGKIHGLREGARCQPVDEIPGLEA